MRSLVLAGEFPVAELKRQMKMIAPRAERTEERKMGMKALGGCKGKGDRSRGAPFAQ